MAIYDKASLVLIPSGTKTSKVYSQKPTNGDGDFTFSRSTAATRVNASGNIEKETGNLLLHSNTFSNGDWLLTSNTTITGGQSGYDGSNDAWLLTKDSTQYRAVYQNLSITGVWTLSIYAKAGTLNQVTLRDSDSQGRVEFNLSDGSVDNVRTENIIAYDISSVGGGWYRCQVSFSGTTSRIQYYADFGGLTAGNIYIQDAQLEQGLVARNYIETTTTAIYGGITDNVPRLDYTDSSCPALLLEPQRTNLITSSEALSIGTSGSTTEQNTADTTSPEGYYNATKILGSASYLAKGVGSAFSGNNTTSVFLKHGNDSEVGVYMYDGAYYRVIFDITNGTIVSTFGGATGTITDYGNGWYRCTIYKSTSANVVEVGVDGLAGYVYTYGWQHEYNASYPTSYIPTYGSAVTRNQDACSVSNIGDLINDSEGTFYAEIQAQANDSAAKVLTIGDGTSLNRLQIFYHLGTNITTNIISNGSSQVTDFTSSIDQTDNIKVAIRYANNNAKMFLNGVEIGSDTSVTTPTGLDVLRFNNGTGGSLFFGYLRNLIYIPTAITDQEAIDLTTI